VWIIPLDARALAWENGDKAPLIDGGETRG
jgi:hypothetical protein